MGRDTLQEATRCAQITFGKNKKEMGEVELDPAVRRSDEAARKVTAGVAAVRHGRPHAVAGRRDVSRSEAGAFACGLAQLLSALGQSVVIRLIQAGEASGDSRRWHAILAASAQGLAPGIDWWQWRGCCI